MKIGRFELLAQLGAGEDGVAYRGRDPADDELVEVRVLRAAWAETPRGKRLARQLRQAALVEHPTALGLRAVTLDHDPLYAVLEWCDQNLADAFEGRTPLSLLAAVSQAHDLAGALTNAHRLGLAHGRLGPAAVRVTAHQDWKLDFTGLQCQPLLEAAAALHAACAPPETIDDFLPDPAADVYGLGAILLWLLTGRPPARAAASRSLELAPLAHLDAVTDSESRGPVPRLAAAVEQLLRGMLAAEPSERPSAKVVEARLGVLLYPASATSETGPDGAAAEVPARAARKAIFTNQAGSLAATTEVTSSEPPIFPLPAGDALARGQLGRFRLLEKLGEGGMGAVYRAEDQADGTIVALKVLSARASTHPTALKRLHKEARLLAEVNNPYVANLLEVNEDDGILYLALEYVPGQSLDRYLRQHGKLDERTALAILADVARALTEAHERGIVHRDIKPDNILVVRGPESGAQPPPETWSLEFGSPRVKLTDFGLARHIVESESLNVTRAGAVVGTPLYMSPEQCGGGTVDARSDVYAMGATLFHLLAGRPPFVGDNPLAIITMHRNDPPPPLRKLNPEASEAVGQIIDKALAKQPDRRYATAGEMLGDLERLLRGEPTSIIVHPRLPPCDPKRVLEYDWTWELEATPEQLWPHVSNTERLNRAVGLSAVQFTAEAVAAAPAGAGLARPSGPRPSGTGTDDRSRPVAPLTATHPPQVRRFGTVRKVGMVMAWEEHPFEWIEGRRFGVLREFKQGPFKWLMSVVELTPKLGGGTTLTHRVRIEPSGLLGRTAAAVEVGIRSRRALERVYQRIDAALTGKLGDPALVDFFEEPAVLSGDRRQRLDHLIEQLIARQVDPAVAEQLGEFLAHAPDQDVARIRPFALARRLSLDPNQVVAACLHGAREGLLTLLWDILCPVCRIPSEVKDTLRALQEHGRCDACHLDYELDFANSVEMIFRVHPEVRACELRTYCIGGPAHSPHVAAQVRVGPKERLVLDLELPEGAYRLRGPQLPFSVDFRVQPTAPLSRWELSLARGPSPELPRSLRAGTQILALSNEFDQELVVRVERTAPRADALTAARASALALFRELFPGEVLSPGQLISVATVTLLMTDLEGASELYAQNGDARAFAVIHEHFRLLNERIRLEGGALVKTVGEGVVAAFHEPVAAVRAGLELPNALARSEATQALKLRLAIHRGPAMAATLNDHLDYFGTTVNLTAQLLGVARGGDVLLSNAVAGDPAVAALLKHRGLEGEITGSQRLDQTGGVRLRKPVAAVQP